MIRDVVAVVSGVYAFCRAGELDFCREDIAVTMDQSGDRVRSVSFIFRHGKAVGGKSRIAFTRPIVRTGKNDLLLRVWTIFRSTFEALRPSERVFPGSTSQLRAMLRCRFGIPPVMPGESSPLPWSLRATGATFAFAAGIPLLSIMRMGRWSSEVSLAYCVLNADAQAVIWRRADDLEWNVE